MPLHHGTCDNDQVQRGLTGDLSEAHIEHLCDFAISPLH